MSSATKSSANHLTFPRDVAVGVGRTALASVRAAAFWSAVLLPVAILLSTVSGIATPTVAAGLVAINAACAVLGHGHTPKR